MNLIRVLFSGNSRPTLEMFENLSRSAWIAVASVLFGLIRNEDHSLAEFFFVGDGGKVVADGSADVVVRAGLGLFHDAAEGDPWIGKVKPIMIDADKALAFSTNSDASGDDRIDLLQIRPVQSDGAEFNLEHKDPNTETKFVEERDTEREWSYEYQIKQGAPSAAPSAPSVDPGWVALAEVARPNGQAGVTVADVTDVRPQSSGLAMGFFRAASSFILDAGANIRFKGAGASFLALVASGGALTLVDEADASAPIHCKNTARVVAFIDGAATPPVVTSGFGVESVEQNGSVPTQIDITLDEDPGADAIILATPNLNRLSPAAWQKDHAASPRQITVAFEDESGAAVRTAFYLVVYKAQ